LILATNTVVNEMYDLTEGLAEYEDPSAGLKDKYKLLQQMSEKIERKGGELFPNGRAMESAFEDCPNMIDLKAQWKVNWRKSLHIFIVKNK